MIVNDNSVNIEVGNRGYHHGDLWSAVLVAGHRLLEKSDAETLSLREIAREVGVSATAIYRHFPDKNALLLALAKQGMEQLAAQQARANTTGDKAGFAASGQAYVRFAIANPALFRLIFSYLPAGAHPLESYEEGSAAWLLRRDIGAIMGDDVSKDKQFAAAMRSWALVHGLAMLILDRQIDPAIAEEMITHVIGEDSIDLG